MAKLIVSTGGAPEAIGPYSQGVRAGQFVFTAGQVGLDPATGTMVSGDVAAQTRRALQNIQAILEAGGSSLGAVVRTTVYLVDMDEFAAMNGAYAEYFPQNRPARATVQVTRLPAAARVEIDAIAVVID